MEFVLKIVSSFLSCCELCCRGFEEDPDKIRLVFEPNRVIEKEQLKRCPEFSDPPMRMNTYLSMNPGSCQRMCSHRMP